MTCLLRLVLLALSMASPAAAVAHDLGLARISVVEDARGGFRLTAKLSGSVAVAPAAFPGPCAGRTGPVHKPTRRAQVVEISLTCPGLSARDRLVRLPWKVEGAHLILADGSGREPFRFVRARADGVWLTAGDLRGGTADIAETVLRYVELGVRHILSGLDHLAVVVLLCVIATGWRLLKLVTCFTIGHSITLALAALGAVQVPVAFVEVMIALSIAFLAREAIAGADPARHSPLLITGFGLLHGLGFASYLAGIGLPRDSVVTALLSFNVGVEIGQLAVVAVVALVLHMVRRFPVAVRPVGIAVPVILGAVAMTWTIERAHTATAAASSPPITTDPETLRTDGSGRGDDRVSR